MIQKPKKTWEKDGFLDRILRKTIFFLEFFLVFWGQEVEKTKKIGKTKKNKKTKKNLGKTKKPSFEAETKHSLWRDGFLVFWFPAFFRPIFGRKKTNLSQCLVSRHISFYFEKYRFFIGFYVVLLRATAHAADPSVGPKQQPPGDGLKTAKHHLNPDANPAKNPPPQGCEVTSLKPLKEKKQAPARGHKTQRNLAQTRPKQQPPGDGLKTAKHHLNPDANPAKNPPPQGCEVTSLKPIKEKNQAPARGQKTQRNLAQPHPKQQPPRDGLKTAKHHLNPDANPAKNPPPQGCEVTSLKPLKEKKQAPARGQKTRRNLVQTRPKQQPPGDGLKTAKHHLNPDANPAKNPPPQGCEVTSLKPIKEKKQAPARGHKTQRNLAQPHPKQQPPGDGLKTAKHHLNPDANPAKNPPPQGCEVTSLKPIKEKNQAPARGQKTQRNLAQPHPKQQPPGDGLKTAKHHLNPDANPAKNPPPQGCEVTSLKPLKDKKQAPARGHKTQRNLAQTRPKQQPPGDGLKTAKHHLNRTQTQQKTLPRRVAKWQVWNP